MKNIYFWPIAGLTSLPILAGLFLIGWQHPTNLHVFLLISVLCAGFLLIYLNSLFLRPIRQLETILQQILEGELPEAPAVPAPWQAIAAKLKSFVYFLRINQQGAEDKITLLEQQNSELKEKELSLKKAYQTLERANQVQNELRGLMDVNKLLEEAVEVCVTNISAQKGFFLKLDLNRPEQALVCSPFGCSLTNGHPLAVEPLLPHLRTVNLAEPHIIHLQGDKELPDLGGLPFAYALLAPVVIDNEIWGLFCLMDKESRGGGLIDFSAEDQQLLRNIAGNLAKDWKSAYLFELATIDSLSQLYVRRYFEKRLDEEILRANRYGEEFSLLMLDIDHFKRFNDNYGHQMGDTVIYLVAKTLKECVRLEVDLVGRYGGEEMIVLLPQTGLAAAQRVAERIRQQIQEIQLPPLDENLKIAASLGVAAYHVDVADRQKWEHLAGKEERIRYAARERNKLIHRADEALYAAKEQGRNRVCLAQPTAEQVH